MKYFQSDTYPIEFVLSEQLDKEYPVHTHVNHWILTMVVLGNIEIEIKGSKKKCFCGDYFILPPDTSHALSLNKNARLLSLCIEKDYLNMHDCNGLRVIYGYVEGLCQRLNVPEKYGEQFMDLLTKLCDTDIFHYEAGPGDMEELALMMISKPESEYALDNLEQKIHLNKYQLIKKFKQHFGLSPHQFLIQSRVRKAQRLLKCEAVVSDISARLGFYDQSHFDKAFHKIVGISPIEYIHSKEILERFMEEN